MALLVHRAFRDYLVHTDFRDRLVHKDFKDFLAHKGSRVFSVHKVCVDFKERKAQCTIGYNLQPIRMCQATRFFLRAAAPVGHPGFTETPLCYPVMEL